MTGLVDTVLKRVGVANPSVGPAPSSAVMNTYGRFPLTLVRGKGCWVWDDRGQRYLDAVAGIATDTLGHSDQVMRRQLQRQLRRLPTSFERLCVAVALDSVVVDNPTNHIYVTLLEA